MNEGKRCALIAESYYATGRSQQAASTYFDQFNADPKDIVGHIRRRHLLAALLLLHSGFGPTLGPRTVLMLTHSGTR